MGSTRLPGKVLLDVAGEPLLARVVERARRATALDAVVVATTTDGSDDAIATLCAERGYPVFRGHPSDVLDRYYQAATRWRAEVVVRITADCPLIDPMLIDLTFEAFTREGVDFAANRLPPPWGRTYPKGLDVEVCSFEALVRAWTEATERYEREHVMPYLYAREDRFRIYILQHTPDLGHVRIAVDEPADLELVRAVYRHFEGRIDFAWEAVVDFLEARPELGALNAAVVQKSVWQE